METELIIPRIRDAIRLCDTSSMPKFVGFLTSAEAATAASFASKQNCEWQLFGGYDGAERVYFGVFPDWCEDKGGFYPIASVTFTFRCQDRLTHRDFLGALMSLGIERQTVGDILIEEGRAVVFLSRDIFECVMNGIAKVANVGVGISEGFIYPLPGASQLKDITDTVASARLDCIVAALVNCSRGQAATLVEDGLVAVNSVCVEKTVKTVKNGDKITVRGKGKFVIDSVEDRTRKDRIILKAKKYM